MRCCPLPAPQPARTRKQNLLLFCKRLIGFVLSHWSKVVILGIIITLIVLVSIKVWGAELLAQRNDAQPAWGRGVLHAGTAARAASESSADGACVSMPAHQACHVPLQGFGFFGDLLSWFQRHNGWAGWGIFVGAGGSSSHVLHIALRAAGLRRRLCLPLSAPQHCLTLSACHHHHRHTGMYTAMVALFLPGVVLILGAGFVFGFWRGLLAVWAGGAVGQALAFLLARCGAERCWSRQTHMAALGEGLTAATLLSVLALWAGLHGLHVWQPVATRWPTHPHAAAPPCWYLFRDWVESTLKTKWKRWEIIDKAIEHDGWKLVLIMRFSPIIPYNLVRWGGGKEDLAALLG